mmetsp:Transcript_11259/g.14065  ORF Transcript_11259/g.14065 Transcript_11259/m.14065 type:complete len:324 (+) Transcript_11259:161-1132(+)|eukprot:CAMPEP_0204829252 /NCGR_PEP_ID=MMETSP1346-20131115/7340_1 /ASSEMBLY_ACC=CAM_ASM_000771 /TAXON_ID=215587 /ORGANISM="Aplanochytrium stocchinoi, Strain GSBS06" /LENGTH=323 /DNA_ID=CAMNT_0051958885 /DNA_START=192 /DNA_END=1163 /DNA_ORIENTATION=+
MGSTSTEEAQPRKVPIQRRSSLHEQVAMKLPSRPRWVNFLTGASGALSGWMLVHPFDLIKVRSQLLGESSPGKISMTQVAKDILKNEGPTGFYGGLSAAVARQLSYGNLRLGFYATFRELAVGQDEPSDGLKLGLGLCAGGLAAFISNPIEVALVRMQADGRLPASEKRNYRGVFNALGRITRDEGVLTLWRGATPTVARAMVVNALQVGGYDIAKSKLKPFMDEGVQLHICSSLISGFVYSAATLPLDTAKTRMQTQTPLSDGSLKYTSIVQTITTITRSEGVLSLWNGFAPYFARCGGHTVTMFLFLEQYKKLADHYYPLR